MGKVAIKVFVGKNDTSVRVLDLGGQTRYAAISQNAPQIRPLLAFSHLSKIDEFKDESSC